MSMTPRVSVVMNCFNGARYLREALDSVFAQTVTDFEIVFYDNASSDESAAIAQSYGEKVRYFRSATTTSLGQARNAAFREARGELIAMLDVDDAWLPGRLEAQLPLMEADPGVGLAYCDAVLFDEAGRESRFFETVQPRRGNAFAALLACNFICTGTMLFRRSALSAIAPLFEPDMTMVMDYFLTLKVAHASRLDFAPAPLVRHRVHAGSESSRKWQLFSVEIRSMLDRLAADVPDVSATYAPALAAAVRAADLQLGLDAWTLGRIREARAALAPHAGRSLVHTLALLATWGYPWPFPAERIRRLKHGLAMRLGRKQRPFRTHGETEAGMSSNKHDAHHP